jgi:hypothetical protein
MSESHCSSDEPDFEEFYRSSTTDPIRSWIASIPLPRKDALETKFGPVLSPCGPQTVTFRPSDRSSFVSINLLVFDDALTIQTDPLCR